jgi:hypothetical protein
MGVQPVWIGTASVVLIGIGIITAVSQTRRRDTPPSSQTDQT